MTRETVAQDVRYAFRTFRRSPTFTIVSVMTLALAIGANTAMFSVLNAVLLRPLPYRSPDELVMLWTALPGQQGNEGRSAAASIERWQSESKSFVGLAMYDPVSVTLTGAGDAEQVGAIRVSPNYFSLLGIQPFLGRGFSDEQAGARERVALISHRLWQRRFGSAPGAVGASIQIDGATSRIVGVLPADLQSDRDVWEPHTLFPDWDTRRLARGAGSWFVVGRLRPHVTVEQAQTEMTAIARRLDEELPASDRHRGVSVVPMSAQFTTPGQRLALWMLMGAVLCVLLIAATNVAGLVVARTANREREIAIRLALGASRGRIIRQLLTESVTLAVVSGIVGLAVGLAAMRVILAIRPGDLPRLDEVTLDPTVLSVTSAVCVLTGVLVGLAPAMTMGWRKLTALTETGRGISGSAGARRIRRVLVVTEFALAIVLLIGAGLLIRSLWSIERVDPGFRSERVLVIAVTGQVFKTPAERTDAYSRILEQVEALPGVVRAGMTGDFVIGGSSEELTTTEGAERATAERLRFRRDEVSDGYFETLGTPLLRGRFFSNEDTINSPPVVIINDAMARRLWPGRDPVGLRFKVGGADSDSPWLTVAGVVGDMHRQGLEREPIPQMFDVLARDPSRLATLLVRTSADEPLTMAASIRAAVRRADPRVPVYGMTTLDARLGTFLTPRRFQTGLLIAFAAVALLMAAIGIYGLIQYSVETRSAEIAVRMAVGADAGQIFRMIIAEGLKLGFVGLALGLIGGWWLGRAGSSLLFGVTPADPLTFAGVSLLLTFVALAACYFPARRAMNVQPTVAFRQ